jgi:hypothetical protein
MIFPTVPCGGVGPVAITCAPGSVNVTAIARPIPWATRDSWFKKEDYNQSLLIAKGNVITMFMNGHLISVFIDNDQTHFRRHRKSRAGNGSDGRLFYA